MPRLSVEKRDEVIELAKKGLPQSEIAKRMNTSRCTINNLIKRVRTTGSTDDRPRPGRPRVMPVKQSSWFFSAEEERPFVCTECGKTFKKFSGLKGHAKIHEETRRYQCDQCGRSFVSSTSLQRHMRCHTGEKPYICEYCARGFADSNTLKVHIRTHTGERPHKCHLCGHSCTSAGNLHAHMKVHRDKETGQVPWPINVKLPKSKSVPIFPKKDLQKRAEINDSIEAWCEGKSSSKCKSQQTFKKQFHDFLRKEKKGQEISRCKTSKLKKHHKTCNDKVTAEKDYKIRESGNDEHFQDERLDSGHDMFTYRTSVLGDDHQQCQKEEGLDSSLGTYEVLIKQETDDDISEGVSRLVSSHGDAPEGKLYTVNEEEKHCHQKESPCIHKENAGIREKNLCTQEGSPCISEEDIKQEPVWFEEEQN